MRLLDTDEISFELDNIGFDINLIMTELCCDENLKDLESFRRRFNIILDFYKRTIIEKYKRDDSVSVNGLEGIRRIDFTVDQKENTKLTCTSSNLYTTLIMLEGKEVLNSLHTVKNVNRNRFRIDILTGNNYVEELMNYRVYIL